MAMPVQQRPRGDRGKRRIERALPGGTQLSIQRMNFTPSGVGVIVISARS